jgi:hypothetical protein
VFARRDSVEFATTTGNLHSTSPSTAKPQPREPVNHTDSSKIRYELAYKANIEWVVFTCGKPISNPPFPSLPIPPPIHSPTILLTYSPGSSRGRGPRCASWFLEHVREVAGDNDMQVLVLEGGLKGWVKGGERFTGLMDGYRKEYWEEVFREEEEEKKKEGEKGQVVGV